MLRDFQIWTTMERVAENCYYEKDYEILKKIFNNSYYSNSECSGQDFLERVEEYGSYTLYDIEIKNHFSEVFNEYEDFFVEWLNNEAFSIGRESILSFLEKDLKIEIYDILDCDSKALKETIVRAFIYSSCTALYDYFREAGLYKLIEIKED